MSNIDIMEQELQAAKGELKKKQEEFLWFIQHDMDTSTFERNAINDLLIMLALKEKIKLLEKYQSRKNI